MSSSFESGTAERALPPNLRDPERIKKVQRDYAIKSTVTNIEVLAGSGNLEHARILAARLLKYDESSETTKLLESGLARAGQLELLKSK